MSCFLLSVLDSVTSCILLAYLSFYLRPSLLYWHHHASIFDSPWLWSSYGYYDVHFASTRSKNNHCQHHSNIQLLFLCDCRRLLMVADWYHRVSIQTKNWDNWSASLLKSQTISSCFCILNIWNKIHGLRVLARHTF